MSDPDDDADTTPAGTSTSGTSTSGPSTSDPATSDVPTPDPSSVDLSKADLSKADLSKADLSPAELPTDSSRDDPAGDASAPVRPVAAPLTGSPSPRPTPAASAASRARRIGGAAARPVAPAPAGTGAGAAAEAKTGDGDDGRNEPVTEQSGSRFGLRRSKARETATDAGEDAGRGTRGRDAAAAGEDPVSMRKRAPRASSARALKDEARTDSAVVTEVPAWLRWAPAAVLSACAVAMIVIIAIAAHGVWYAKPSVSAERDKVLAAAKKCMAAVNTYNYKTLPADEKRGLACSTGAWTAQYKSAVTNIVTPSATKLKASQTVRINAAGIESVSDSGAQWTTVVYGQVNLNQSGATPRIDPFAAVVLMDKVGSTYKISKINLITQPASS